MGTQWSDTFRDIVVPGPEDTTPRAVMHRAMDFIMRLQVEANGWDEHPELILVMEPEAGDHRPTLVIIEIPAYIWEMHPIQALNLTRLVVDKNPEHFARDKGSALIGMIYSSEVWALNPDAVPEDEWDQVKQQIQTMSLADHPYGVEAKSLMGYAVDDSRLFMQHMRGVRSTPVMQHRAVGPLEEVLSGLFDSVKQALA